MNQYRTRRDNITKLRGKTDVLAIVVGRQNVKEVTHHADRMSTDTMHNTTV